MKIRDKRALPESYAMSYSDVKNGTWTVKLMSLKLNDLVIATGKTLGEAFESATSAIYEKNNGPA